MGNSRITMGPKPRGLHDLLMLVLLWVLSEADEVIEPEDVDDAAEVIDLVAEELAEDEELRAGPVPS